MVELIAHLAEVEARELHLSRGYGSMFTYCREALRFSEHEAYHRVEVARAARRFPKILEGLADGTLNLTTAKLLGRHLTDANHLEIIESARGRSRSEVETIVARLAPAPDVPMSARKLPPAPIVPAPTERTTLAAPSSAVQSRDTVLALFGTGADASALSAPTPLVSHAPASVPVESRPTVVAALSPDRFKLQVTISGNTLEKLRLAQDLLRHANPSGDGGEIIGRALTLLVTDLAKQKFAATDRPRRSAGMAPNARDVSAEVKRVVYVRDLGRCAFVSRDGRRCGERGFIEFHHVRPTIDGRRAPDLKQDSNRLGPGRVGSSDT